jgi:2-dehydro-3-deoxygluconokinase
VSLLNVKPASCCQYDLVALGEVMLRLDPGEGRIRSTRHFQAWEGGGEYNVARGLRRCFGKKTAVVTALVDNDVGRLIEDLMLQGGVDLSFVRWVPSDGVGRTVRNGLNFTERGFGVRGAVGISDRGHTAVSQLKPEDIDWEHLFGKLGVRWLHTGGIFAALSATTAEVALEAMEAARRHGTIISYDLNYRPSLWQSIGGSAQAVKVNRKLASYIDVIFGNEEDFTAALGFEVEGVGANLTALNIAHYQKMIDEVVRTYPNLKVVATTLREVKSASRNDWKAICWAERKLYESQSFPDLEIYDRVGGGDSFASGLIYGLLQGYGAEKSLNYGVAHGALAMTTPGDTSMASLKEVEKLLAQGGARVER